MLPFGAWINVNLHGIEFERTALTGLRRAGGRFLRRADKPLVLLRVQHFLAVKTEIEVVHALQNLLRLARLHIELVHLLRWTAFLKVDGIELRPFHKIKNTGLAGEKSVVIARRDRIGENA